MDDARKRELLEGLVAELAEESGAVRSRQPLGGNAGVDELWDVFRAYVNMRPPYPASEPFMAAQDELLQGLIAEAGISTIDDALPSPEDERLLLWRGDITTLAVDAIVNAANSQMLGCWVPGHFCIDNAIHTYAGVQLRRECYEIMEHQGHEEPTGEAKMTSAWNLPSSRVIHTVGPIANGRPTDVHREQLASSYRSCLESADGSGLRTIAFCCISTGVFGFPADEAARIAVRTVRTWLDGHSVSGMRVVFNVFGASDERIYRALLEL